MNFTVRTLVAGVLCTLASGVRAQEVAAPEPTPVTSAAMAPAADSPVEENATAESAAAEAPAADPQAANAPAVSTPPSPGVPPLELPPERNWRLGLALGYGKRTNPLIQSDDIPVLVDVDIAWFGKRWFFDNGDLGFGLVNNDRFTTNLVARVNSDRTFFSKTNTRFVTFTQMSGGVTVPIVDPGSGAPSLRPEPLKPPKRDYAIELGLETLIDGDWGSATLRAFHDVSGTHDGYEVGVSYDYPLTRGRFSLSPTVGVAYKDHNLSDYYWGVHEGDSSITLQTYEAGGGLSWEAGLHASYYLSKRTRLALAANYERLQHTVGDSPLVEQPYVFGYFAGVAWSF